jgi:hypothetical protein
MLKCSQGKAEPWVVVRLGDDRTALLSLQSVQDCSGRQRASKDCAESAGHVAVPFEARTELWGGVLPLSALYKQGR